MVEMEDGKVCFRPPMKKSIQLEYSVWLLILHLGLIIIRAPVICINVRYFVPCWSMLYLHYFTCLINYRNCHMLFRIIFETYLMSCRWENKQWGLLHKQSTIVQIKSYTNFRYVQIVLVYATDCCFCYLFGMLFLLGCIALRWTSGPSEMYSAFFIVSIKLLFLIKKNMYLIVSVYASD